jgi:hypothetical protein
LIEPARLIAAAAPAQKVAVKVAAAIDDGSLAARLSLLGLTLLSQQPEFYATAPAPPASSGGSNTGAIVGGVVGGIAALAGKGCCHLSPPPLLPLSPMPMGHVWSATAPLPVTCAAPLL